MYKHQVVLFVLFVVCNVMVITMVSMGRLTHDYLDPVCLSAEECQYMEHFSTAPGAKYYPAPALLTPRAGWSRYNRKDEVKYFREPEGVAHADYRYFAPSEYHNPGVRARRVRLMFAAWAAFADENRIPYWIVHGSLIGHYFGEHMLPWDDDMDLQMTYGDLVSLTRFNQTWLNEEFFIDVNPYLHTRVHMHLNVIDARVIDRITGAFMDITGVAVVKKTVFGVPIYACKSPHDYYYHDLFPLIRTQFEGTSTWRPNNEEKLLLDEYNRGVLTNFNFEHHHWNGSVWEYAPDKPKSKLRTKRGYLLA